MINLENIVYKYCKELDNYDKFEMKETLMILLNLNDVNIPNKLKSITKSFYALLITNTIWQKNSKLLNKILSSEDEDPQIKV